MDVSLRGSTREICVAPTVLYLDGDDSYMNLHMRKNDMTVHTYCIAVKKFCSVL